MVILFGLARWTANKSRKYHYFTGAVETLAVELGSFVLHAEQLRHAVVGAIELVAQASRRRREHGVAAPNPLAQRRRGGQRHVRLRSEEADVLPHVTIDQVLLGNDVELQLCVLKCQEERLPIIIVFESSITMVNWD